jgi:hypothetical protein
MSNTMGMFIIDALKPWKVPTIMSNTTGMFIVYALKPWKNCTYFSTLSSLACKKNANVLHASIAAIFKRLIPE